MMISLAHCDPSMRVPCLFLLLPMRYARENKKCFSVHKTNKNRYIALKYGKTTKSYLQLKYDRMLNRKKVEEI